MLDPLHPQRWARREEGRGAFHPRVPPALIPKGGTGDGDGTSPEGSGTRGGGGEGRGRDSIPPRVSRSPRGWRRRCYGRSGSALPGGYGGGNRRRRRRRSSLRFRSSRERRDEPGGAAPRWGLTAAIRHRARLRAAPGKAGGVGGEEEKGGAVLAFVRAAERPFCLHGEAVGSGWRWGKRHFGRILIKIIVVAIKSPERGG